MLDVDLEVDFKMTSCKNCKHFRSSIPYEEVDRCVARETSGKVLSNFGILFMDLGKECKDYEAQK